MCQTRAKCAQHDCKGLVEEILEVASNNTYIIELFVKPKTDEREKKSIALGGACWDIHGYPFLVIDLSFKLVAIRACTMK